MADEATSILQLVSEALQLTGGEQALLDRFAGAETVLVLDNCEHVIDGAADAGHPAAGPGPAPADPHHQPGAAGR